MNTTPEIRLRLQRELPTIRSVAGWSAEDLADLLEISRQTIVNLENADELKMTVVQYRAIRSLIDDKAKEMESACDDTLNKVTRILVDMDDSAENIKKDIRKCAEHAKKESGRRAGAQATSFAVTQAITANTKLRDIPLGSLIGGAAILGELLYGKNKHDNGKEKSKK